MRWILIATAITAVLAAATTGVFWYRRTTGGLLTTTPAPPASLVRFIGTRVIATVAVDANGHPANGYRLAPAPRDPAGVSEVFGCDASRAAIADNIYSCAPSAAGADVCWPSERHSLLCLDDPWAKTLHRVVQTSPLPNVHPTATPAPFALLLDDGTQCRLRNGGASGGRDDGLVGAYGCPGETPAVLVAATPNPGTPAIDRSQTIWTVKVGSLGPSDAHFPPPQTRTVATAWFAGDP
ncbi:hypothetical protein B2J96_18875 [Mycobacterium shigaense]|nr:hypothetical protein B2J96_18875 [Mycobacterium shigaense]